MGSSDLQRSPLRPRSRGGPLIQPVDFQNGAWRPSKSPGTKRARVARGDVPRTAQAESAQRELNPHICLGKAAGGHYIMGAARTVSC